jgi:light-independent protochlorophyllide reductase subunit B
MSARCASPPHAGVHCVLHAPQGDTYADLLFTMIERRDKRPPVTYTTFQARDLGGDTAELFKTLRDAYERFKPAGHDAGRRLLHRRADPGRARRPGRGHGPPVPVVPLELPAYSAKENWGADETFFQLVRGCCGRAARATSSADRGPPPAATCWARPRSASAAATTSPRSPSCWTALGVEVNVVAPAGRHARRTCCAPRGRLQRLPLPRDRRDTCALAGARPSAAVYTKTVPIGVGATRDFLREVGRDRRHRPDAALAETRRRACPGTRARSIRPT